MPAPKEVLKHVERFERNRDAYRFHEYNETQARREFIDPLFKTLGWDVDNEQGYAEAYKDVIHEDAIKVGGATKAPDYAFGIYGLSEFYRATQDLRSLDLTQELFRLLEEQAYDPVDRGYFEGTPNGVIDPGRNWWPQAEGIVGFYNVYQLTGEERLAQAAIRCWRYAQGRFVDRTHGYWSKRLTPDGTPDPTRGKAGPWDCQYHHSRACLEMLDRLDEPG